MLAFGKVWIRVTPLCTDMALDSVTYTLLSNMKTVLLLKCLQQLCMTLILNYCVVYNKTPHAKWIKTQLSLPQIPVIERLWDMLTNLKLVYIFITVDGCTITRMLACKSLNLSCWVEMHLPHLRHHAESLANLPLTNFCPFKPHHHQGIPQGTVLGCIEVLVEVHWAKLRQGSLTLCWLM